MGGSCGLSLAELEKLEPGWASIMSPLEDVRQSSRSSPSRIRMSMARALDGWEMTLKNAIVLAKRSLSVFSSMNFVSVGSLNAAARVKRLPHCLWKRVGD